MPGFELVRQKEERTLQSMGHWKLSSCVIAKSHWPYCPAVQGVSHEMVEAVLKMSDGPLLSVFPSMERMSTKVAVDKSMTMPPPYKMKSKGVEVRYSQ